MFSNAGIHRCLKKGRVWLVIGATVLILALLASSAVGFIVVRNRESAIMESNVSFTVRTMADRFENLIVDGVMQLKIAGANAEYDQMEQAIRRISETEMFDGAAILNERSQMIAQSGSVPSEKNNSKVIRYSFNDAIAYIDIHEDERIGIRLPNGGNYTIEAWLRQEYIDRLFSKEGQQFDYCLYNETSGAFIINHSVFSEPTYFDALLARNESGRLWPLLKIRNAQGVQAQALVTDKRIDYKDAYYIAQADTGIADISAAIVIPMAQLYEDLQIQGRIDWMIGVLLGAALLLVLICALLAFRHENRVMAMVTRNGRVNDMLLHRASNGARITLMLYDSVSDRFNSYCESDKDRKQNGDALPQNLRELSDRYQIAEEDLERIYAACRGLKPDERTSLNVIAIRKDGDRNMHLHLHATEEPGLIVCSMYDSTNEAKAYERLQQEEIFRASVLPRCMASWDVNINTGKWKATYCARNVNRYMRDLMAKAEELRDYEFDLAHVVRTVVHPDDYQSYIDTVGVDALTAMHHSGIVENVHEYRVHSEQNNGYEWHRQIVRVQNHGESDEITASLYIININAERMAESERRERSRILQQSLTALGGLYFALFYIDLDKDICYTAKAPKGEMVTQLTGPYRATFDAYIDGAVHPEDRERIRSILSSYMLRKQMTESDHLVCGEYRRKVDDKYEDAMLLIQAARFENGTVRDVVVALRDLDKGKL